MFTSYYGNIRNIPPEFRPIGISRGVPKWYSGETYQYLAPTYPMLKMPKAKYDELFEEILKKLDPRKVYKALGENAVMLCWETPDKWCHRRRVAEWLEQSLGIVVPEFGLPREKAMSYYPKESQMKLF